MSFVQDHVRTIDAHLERVQFDGLSDARSAFSSSSTPPEPSPHLGHLQRLIDAVSVSSRATPSKQSAKALVAVLQDARSYQTHDEDAVTATGVEAELQWVLVGKVVAQAYGLVLDAVLRQTLPINDELWYWNQVSSSYRYTALYSLQTSPLRLYDWTKTVYTEVRQRRNPVAQGWHDLYTLVRNVVRERSVADLQTRVASPLTLLRADVRRKIATLEHAKALNASAAGYLLSNCFDSDSLQHMSGDDDVDGKRPGPDHWKAGILKAISVMSTVLFCAHDSSTSGDSLDQSVAANLAGDDLTMHYTEFFNPRSSLAQPALKMSALDAAARVEDLLSHTLTTYDASTTSSIRAVSRPGRLVRYWLPATALLLSSSTILRILVSRRASIVQWVRDLGATSRDFWLNWVVEPTRKIIGTIRHDAASEVSIMSRASLDGDRASLERMVVDFVVDNPEGPALSASDIDAVRSKIQAGDLTPVLRAYEKDLKSPLTGSLRGNLIRALLIQIQKTKVDVEVAIGGIDSLLKSQELVFGFVGLTPGLLVTVAAWRYLGSVFSSRKDLRRGTTQRRTYAILRNVDRILTGSPQANDGVLSVKDFGLLVCEAVILRDVAQQVLDKTTFREFRRDFDDLIDRESGVGRQIRVAERIRWAYGRWL